MPLVKTGALCTIVLCLLTTIGQAKTIKNTFEKKRFRYHPSKIDQARKLAVVKDGALYVTVEYQPITPASRGTVGRICNS